MQTTRSSAANDCNAAPPITKHFALPPEYVLIRSLGVGGTAEVSLVRRICDSSLLALKRPLETNADFANQAQREIHITKHLHFPAVANVTELVPGSPSQGLLLPYFPGLSLDQFKERLNPIGLMNLLSALSISLYYLHLKGVVHGDMKPHNIFLPFETSAEDFSQSKLFYPRFIDFSMALNVGEDPATRLGIGTLGYTAPETLDEKPLTHQADLFSLGVIAYYLVTGEHPFISDRADPAEISAAVKEDTPTPIDVGKTGIPVGLVGLIDSLLEKTPSLRPKCGFAVCEKLETLGATYPFRKAIQPRHLLPTEQQGDVATISVMPGFDLPSRNELFKISDGDVVKLRLILDTNLRLGKLRWTNGVIRASADFENYHWSNRMRRHEYALFKSLTLTEARWAVKCAVANGSANMGIIERPPKHLRPAVVTPSLVEALRHELSERTYCTQSLALAESLQSSPKLERNLELCARLFIRTSELARSVDLTLRFCDSLAKDNREVEALPLLQLTQALAHDFQNTEYEIALLHRDGDIRKNLGDMVGAEERYLKLLKLANDKPSIVLAETYKDLGDLYKLKQNFESGVASLKRARELYEHFCDTTELARVENNLGNLYVTNAEYELALISYRRSLKLHRKRNHAANIASTVDNIATVFAFTGRSTRAVRIYEISLRLKREVGHQGEIARTLNNLGYTQFMQGNTTLALTALAEALKINQTLGSKKESLYNLDSLASCSIVAGRFDQALGYIREGRDSAEELRDKLSKASLELSLAKIFTRTGLWSQAERLTLRAEKISYDINDKTLTIRCLLQLAELRKRQASITESTEFAERALQVSRDIDDRQGAAQAALLLADDNLKNLHETLTLAEEIDSQRDIAQTALTLSEVYLRKENKIECKKLLAKAARYFDSVEEDIDFPRYLKLCAHLEMSDPEADCAQAIEKLTQAASALHLRQDKSDLWLVEILLGEACMRQGELERAFMALNSVTKTIKYLVKNLPNSASKRRFLKQIEISHMGELIGKLSGKLNLH